MRLYPIEVDEEVFAVLQRSARPLIDSPNDVLRRLLLEGRASPDRPVSPSQQERTMQERQREPSGPIPSADAFVRKVLSGEFGEGFHRRAPYRMMFERTDTLVYCQNFNKSGSHLWYRVTDNPWKELRTSTKEAWVAFTNPTDGFAYLIPVADIKEQVERAGWSRTYLEVNIDPSSERWTEFNWSISKYRREYKS